MLDKYLRFVKYAVWVWSITGAAIYGVMVFKDYDPWSVLINIAEWVFTPGLVVLGLTLVGSLFVERPWCRYACPLGAASGLLGNLAPSITSVDCISCLEYVGECPRESALEVKIGLPLMAKLSIPVSARERS